MCDRCRRRIRFPVVLRGRRHLGEMPTWLDRRAREYVQSMRFNTGNTSVRFGDQVVWTWVRTRFGREEVRPYLCGVEVFEFFPTQRSYYDPIFTVHRSSPGVLGAIRDFFTQEDEIWEALYQSYQMMNEDMHTLAYLRHQRPSAARGFLARLDADLCQQIMEAMIEVVGTYIAPMRPSSVHVLGRVSRLIAQRLGMNTSLTSMIIEASHHQQGNYRASGRP